MDGTYLSRNILFFKFMAMYKPNGEWNALHKIGYYAWRIVWGFCMSFTVIFTLLDVCFRGNNMSDVALNIVNICKYGYTLRPLEFTECSLLFESQCICSLYNILFVVLYSGIIIRFSYFVGNENTVDNLIARINKEFMYKSKLGVENVSMFKSVRNATYLFNGWMGFVLFAGVLMLIMPIFNHDRVLPMPIWTFYDWTQTPYYQITTCIQLLAEIFMVVSYGNIDLFYGNCVYLISQQYEILGANFVGIFPEALMQAGYSDQDIKDYFKYEDNGKCNRVSKHISATINTPEFQQQILCNLNYCITKHQNLLRLTKDFQRFQSPAILIETNLIFCYIVFMLYISVTADSAATIIAISQYCFGSGMQMYLLSIVGEGLTTKVENMRTSFYSIPWYLGNKQFLTNFKIVHIRMRDIIQIKAGGVVPMSMETFVEFMRKAFSFFTVLRQIT